MIDSTIDYDLYAVIAHEGSTLHGGHFVVFVKCSNGIWYCLSDANVKQVSLKTGESTMTYMRDDREGCDDIEQPFTSSFCILLS